MFAFDVMMMSLFDRSSGTISTLPRIMPRSASETVMTSDSLLTGCGAGWACGWLRPRSPRRGIGRLNIDICCAEGFVGALFFSCHFIASSTIA